MCPLHLLFAADKFGSVYDSSPVYFAYKREENSSRCLIKGQKQCGKILKGKFAT